MFVLLSGLGDALETLLDEEIGLINRWKLQMTLRNISDHQTYGHR